METGLSGQHPDDPGEGWIDPNVQRTKRQIMRHGGSNPVANDQETMKNNNFMLPSSRETNDESVDMEKSEKVYVYTVKVNAMLPKGSKDHRPLWLLKELLFNSTILTKKPVL
jgi:hypothetical protein